MRYARRRAGAAHGVRAQATAAARARPRRAAPRALRPGAAALLRAFCKVTNQKECCNGVWNSERVLRCESMIFRD